MSSLRVVPAPDPETMALATICQSVAEECQIDRYELVVKSRLETGINDDNQLREVDTLLAKVNKAKDALEEATRPAISLAFARHRAMTGKVKEFMGRWDVLDGALRKLIIGYKQAKEELARKQQAELDRAAADQRRRLEEEARQAMRDGDISKAQSTQQLAQAVTAPVISQATPVLASTKDREVWEVQITDAMALVKAIAEGVVPLSAIKEFDLVFLRKEAAKRGALAWPGITAKKVPALSVRR